MPTLPTTSKLILTLVFLVAPHAYGDVQIIVRDTTLDRSGVGVVEVYARPTNDPFHVTFFSLGIDIQQSIMGPRRLVIPTDDAIDGMTTRAEETYLHSNYLFAGESLTLSSTGTPVSRVRPDGSLIYSDGFALATPGLNRFFDSERLITSFGVRAAPGTMLAEGESFEVHVDPDEVIFANERGEFVNVAQPITAGQLTVSAIPEPGFFWVLAVPVLLLGCRSRRSRLG
ncbi:MAG: hypothetical protein AAF664_02860 [Planctomycetota bacterium]